MTGAYPLGERPAPSHPVGRLPSLGDQVDRDDAADVLAVLRVCRDRHRRNGSEPVKLAREALDRWWEKRRRTNDRQTGQNLRSYPWSVAALTALDGHLGEGTSLSGRLRLEHLWPAGGVTARVLAHLDGLDPDVLAACLHEELGYAVITQEQDAELSRAGMRATWLADPWDRYRADRLPPQLRADLDPASFRVPEEPQD